MKPTEGYQHPIAVDGELYWLADGYIDHITRLQHVEDGRFLVLTIKELTTGLTNGSIWFPDKRRRNRRKR
ncbi:hypothetical protein [Rhizobium sp. BG4]|uniref:hypothetical protein n=1 Tax=Rhizobium sp. BG4 TaxID=2613770 RepID=UPI00193DD7E9|nr:hypothetical protein [Rhizobium sp. BG4]QRM44598.1 hypothetical protein F2982_14795 [Rhizobium sp. BG4]